MEPTRKPTLIEFVLSQQKAHPEATGVFSILLTQLALAGKIISSEIKQASLLGQVGHTGGTNIYGEQVKKLDDFANKIFVQTLKQSSIVCMVSSEEMEEPAHFESTGKGAKYAIVIDPVDGSSNTDVNGSLGSIFAVYPKISPGEQGADMDLLQPGTRIVAAGYILYGPGTVFVYATKDGVNGFTLDINFGEFLLSHPNLKMPSQGKIYSVNESNYPGWSQAMREFVDHLKSSDNPSGRPHSSRYSGSLTADFHRILLEGGVYLYPEIEKNSQKFAKLRLLYEAAPLAFVAHHAGGNASTGTADILQIKPKDLQERVPLIIGSAEDVALAEKFTRGEKS